MRKGKREVRVEIISYPNSPTILLRRMQQSDQIRILT